MGNEQHNLGHSLTGVFPVRQLLAASIFSKSAFAEPIYSNNANARAGGKKRIRVRSYPQLSSKSEHQRLYKKLFKVMLGILAGFLFLVATVCFALFVYKPYEERCQLAKAQAFLASGDYSQAQPLAEAALKLNPTDVRACKAMADAASQQHSPYELYWAQRLADVAPTTANKLRLAETGLRCQSKPFPVTSSVLTELAQNVGDNPVFHTIAGNLALGLRQPALAEAHFEAALQVNPSNPQYALNLASLQLGANNSAVQQQARQRLEQLSLDETVGVVALRTLVADRKAAGDAVAASKYSDQLLQRPQATMADRLENLEILHGMNSATFNDRLQAVMDMAATNAQSVTELSAWMQFNGLAAESIDWLTSLPKNIRSQESYKLALLQAYLQTAKWQMAINWGNQNTCNGQDFLRLAMLAHAWAQLGVPTVAQSTWSAAVNQAANHYEAMTNLVVLAERWQMSDEQQDLRQRILEIAPQ